MKTDQEKYISELEGQHSRDLESLEQRLEKQQEQRERERKEQQQLPQPQPQPEPAADQHERRLARLETMILSLHQSQAASSAPVRGNVGSNPATGRSSMDMSSNRAVQVVGFNPQSAVQT